MLIPREKLDGCKLLVWPGSCRLINDWFKNGKSKNWKGREIKGEVIEIAGDELAIWKNDFVHSGCKYPTYNQRIFFYIRLVKNRRHSKRLRSKRRRSSTNLAEYAQNSTYPLIWKDKKLMDCFIDP
jgi:hypothetical protein